MIYTNLGRSMPAPARMALAIAALLALKSEAQGAATRCYVAVNPAVADVSGEYFADCNVATPSRRGQDMELALRLWEASEKIVAEVTA